MRRRSPAWARVLLAALLVALFAWPLWQVLALPDHVALAEGSRTPYRVALPLPAQLRLDGSGIVRVRPATPHAAAYLGRAVTLEPVRSGRAYLELRLFGVIPFRRVAVDVLPPVRVVPGGHSIGVLLDDGGVRVVGFLPLGGADARVPAREAGLMVGDLILRADGRPIGSARDLTAAVEAAGAARRPLRLEVWRLGRTFDVEIRPVRDPESGRYAIGVAVREGTAGVGTLTFYDPRTRVFAALGHVIVDRDGRTPLEVRGGRIVPAAVVDVRRGSRGQPGEKVGRFDASGPTLGTITRNTEYGIAGVLERLPEQPLFREPIPIALLHEVREGPAQIVTVVADHKLELFDIVIERVIGNHRGGKNMVVRVTDPRLLRATGGIVQGMSGSPVIQGGRLVGAVTHVFVHEPARGYAVSAEWMVLASGLVEKMAAANLRPTGSLP